MRQAARDMGDLDLSIAALAAADTSLLIDEGEAGLIRKMAEYPRLVDAAALAHELNQPLAAILGNAQAAQNEFGLVGKIYQFKLARFF